MSQAIAFSTPTGARDVFDRVEVLHGHLADLAAAATVADVAETLLTAAVDVTDATCGRLLLATTTAVRGCDAPHCAVCRTDASSDQGTTIRLRDGLLVLGHPDDDDVAGRLLSWLVEQGRLALDRVRSQRSAEEAVADLLRTDHERTEFVEMLVHDLRSPMTALHGFASLLARNWTDFDEDKRADLLAMIQHETDRMNRLVDDVSEAVLGLTGSIPVRQESVDLATVARDLVGSTMVAAPGHHLATDIEPDVPAARGDLDRITQIVANLLDNAVKHTPVGSTVTVAVRRHGHDVEIVVGDDGPGIAPEHRARVFARGGRLDARVPGVGLGLHTARRFADAMGGTLELLDDPDRPGARFALRLPTAPTVAH